MFLDVENRDAIPVRISDLLYQELLECEVEPPIAGSPLASHHQFSQGMLNAEKISSTEWEAELSEDGLVFLLNIALPTNMEMWYSWGTLEGNALLEDAKAILDEFNVYYPY